MIPYVLYNPMAPNFNISVVKEEFAKQQILAWYSYPAVYRKTVVESISEGHKKIVEQALKKRMPEIWICEDDVSFVTPQAAKYFLDNKPKEFDIYCGGVYGLSQEAKEKKEGNLIRIKEITGLHCYIIRERYYEKFLSYPNDLHIDTCQKDGEFYTVYPFAAIQRAGWSANNRKHVDYNLNLATEDLYK